MRYEIGQVYRAVVNGSATFVVVTAEIRPCSQGDTGEARYRVRNLQGTSEEIDLIESAISDRVKFVELCSWFLKQNWDADDIASYLNSYGVAFHHGTLLAYCSKYQHYGDCYGSPKRTTTTQTESQLQITSNTTHSDKLADLSALVHACGGVNNTHRCLTLIENIGGVRHVQQVIKLLTTC